MYVESIQNCLSPKYYKIVKMQYSLYFIQVYNGSSYIKKLLGLFQIKFELDKNLLVVEIYVDVGTYSLYRNNSTLLIILTYTKCTVYTVLLFCCGYKMTFFNTATLQFLCHMPNVSNVSLCRSLRQLYTFIRTTSLP